MMNKFIITIIAFIAYSMQMQAMDNETIAKSFSPNGTITYSYKDIAAIKNQNGYTIYLIFENERVSGYDAQRIFSELEFRFKTQQEQSKKRLEELNDITLLQQ